jgi:hypothetical protein
MEGAKAEIFPIFVEAIKKFIKSFTSFQINNKAEDISLLFQSSTEKDSPDLNRQADLEVLMPS